MRWVRREAGPTCYGRHISFLGWMSLCGGLLLLMALSSTYLRRLPVSPTAIYLAVGVAIGTLGFDWLQVDFCFQRLLPLLPRCPANRALMGLVLRRPQGGCRP